MDPNAGELRVQGTSSHLQGCSVLGALAYNLIFYLHNPSYTEHFLILSHIIYIAGVYKIPCWHLLHSSTNHSDKSSLPFTQSLLPYQSQGKGLCPILMMPMNYITPCRHQMKNKGPDIPTYLPKVTQHQFAKSFCVSRVRNQLWSQPRGLRN